MTTVGVRLRAYVFLARFRRIAIFTIIIFPRLDNNIVFRARVTIKSQRNGTIKYNKRFFFCYSNILFRNVIIQSILGGRGV